MSAKYKSPSFLLPNELNTSANPANDTGINSLYSMDFNSASSDYIDVGISLNGLSSITYSCWVKASSFKNYSYIISAGNFLSGERLFGILLDVNGSFQAYGGQSSAVLDSNVDLSSNTWYHLAVVYTNNQDVAFYVNGAAGSTGSFTNTNLIAASSPTRIGSYSASVANLFDGQIDEVAIFNRALNTTEISALYDGTGSNIRPSNLMASNLNPIAYYPLGEQAQMQGYLGNEASSEWQFPNGVLQDYVMDFDGSASSAADFINTSNTSIGNIGSNPHTFSAWINIADHGQVQTILSNKNSNGWKFEVSSGASPDNITFYISGTNLLRATFPSSSYGSWINAVAVINGSSSKIYINGVDQSASVTGTLVPTDSTEPLIIGAQDNGSGTYIRSLNGQMSNVQIFSSALPATGSNSVQTLYNNGSPLTSMSGFTSLTNWWKLNADSVYTPSAPNYTKALSFVASESDYIDAGNPTDLQITGALTTSCWFKTTDTNYQFLITKDDATNSCFGVGLRQQKIYATIFSSGLTDIETTTTWTDGNWHNVVFVFTPSTSMEIFVDGNSEIRETTGIPSSIDNDPANLNIGRRGNNTRYYTGQLSNAAIYNSALTASQISTLFNFGTPETNISFSPQAWWKLDDQTAITDSSGNGNTGTNNGATDISSGVAVTPSWKIPTALTIPTINYTTAGSFNGTSSKVDIASTSLGTSNTVSFWFYHNSSGSTFGTLVGGSTTTNPGLRSGQAFNIGGNAVYCSFDAAQFVWTNPWYVTGNIKSDNWNHIVFVRDASKPDSDKIQLSINNSTLASYDTIVFATPNFSTPTNIANSIGQGFSGVQIFDGFMSNISTFTTAFNQSQVGTLYNSGQPSADISSLSPVNWWKLDTIGSTITDNGSAGNNGTNTDVTAATTDVKTSDLNIPVNGVSTTLPSTALQQSDLQFDSPYSNYSLSFDGTGDTVSVSGLPTMTGDASISTWINATTNPSFASFLSSRNYSNTANSFSIQNRSGNIYLIIYDTGSTYKIGNFTPSTALIDNWNHIAVIVDTLETDAKVYFNGSIALTVDLTASNVDISDISAGFNISGYSTNSAFPANAGFFDGKIDETSIFNYSLSEAQVLEIYNNGKPKDLSTFSGTAPTSWWRLGENAYFDNNSFIVPNSISGAPNGTGSGTITTMISADAPVTYANGVGTNLDILDRVGDAALSTSNSQSYNMIPSDISPYVPQYVGDQIANNFSMTFDGTNYFDIGTGLKSTFDAATKASVSLWFKASSISSTVPGILFQQESTDAGDNWLFVIRFSTTGQLQTGIKVGSSYPIATYTTSVNTGNWYNVVSVYDGSTLKLYLNGAKVAENLSTGSPLAASSNSAKAMIGATAVPSRYFNGQIDEVAIFDTALNAGQIYNDIYQPTATGTNQTADLVNNPNLPNPVAWYRMGD